MNDNSFNDILFVSAYRNINRATWTSRPRCEAIYLSYFHNMAINIKYNLIVFLEKRLLETLRQKYSKYINISFYDIDLVDSFYQKFLEKDKQIMQSKTYQNKIPERRKLNPECIYSEYNLINHSKINWIKAASNIMPNYQFYSWIDFGMIRNKNGEMVPKNIDIKTLSKNKVTYQARLMPLHKRITENKMLKTGTVYILGSAYIIHKSLINKFENLWENKIIEWQENYITDDDQHLILQLYYDTPDLFILKESRTWFNLFNILS